MGRFGKFLFLTYGFKTSTDVAYGQYYYIVLNTMTRSYLGTYKHALNYNNMMII